VLETTGMRPLPPLLVILVLAPGCGGARAPSTEAPQETLTWTVPGDGHPQQAPAGAPEAQGVPNAPDGETRPPTPPPEEVVVTPLDADRTTDLCRDPLLGRVREALADVPVCERGVPSRFVSVVHRGQQVVVVGYRDDRPTWVDGVARYGSVVLVDGARLEPDEANAFWQRLDSLGTLPAPEVPSLLQAVLLQQRVFGQIPTLAEAEEALAGWPEAQEAVRAQPPGMHADAQGHHMRVWSHRRRAGRAVGCRYLTRHVLTLTHDGRLHVHRDETWATGQEMGRPCGTPLP
jgi:hypothetical protein